VPSLCAEGATVTATGKWMKIAAVRDEQWLDGKAFGDVRLLISRIQASELGADLFTFAQNAPDVDPRHTYLHEWDAAAVIPITAYTEWLEKRAAQDVRVAIRKASRLGVTVRVAEYDENFVRGIVEIYNESPVRQGKAFWHYQKDFDTVARENGTFLDRSTFIGAYHENELIGFIKMVRAGNIAATLQVIGKRAHSAKKPVNALIGKAVELCEEMGLSHLRYGDWGDEESSLTEFKRRNGFEKMLLPRYYVPLTAVGKIGLKLGMHHGIRQDRKSVV